MNKLRHKLIIGLYLLLVLQCANAERVNNKIAYLAHVGNYWQVWVMNADGSQQRQVTDSKYDKSRISWYPDGVHLLINDNNGNLYKLNINTRESVEINLPIKGTLDASVSPDGHYIAFSLSVADSIDNNHIWIVNVDNNKLSKLTNMGGLQHEPVWSSNQQWIYFLSNTGSQSHDILRVSIDGKIKEQITSNNLYNFDISLSKKDKLAYSSNISGNYEIWIKQKNGNASQLTFNEGIDSRPTWSEDEKSIVFESFRKGTMNIYKMKINEKQVQQLTFHKVGARFPVWWSHSIEDKL